MFPNLIIWINYYLYTIVSNLYFISIINFFNLFCIFIVALGLKPFLPIYWITVYSMYVLSAFSAIELSIVLSTIFIINS